MKKERDPTPPGTDDGCKMHAEQAARSADENSHSTDSRVSGEEFLQD